MDGIQTPPQELPPVQPVQEIRPVEIMTGPVFERYSIGEALHQQFLELEQGGYTESWNSPEYWEQEYPSDTEAYRSYMKEVLHNLKESSAVNELRTVAKAGGEITDELCDRVEGALKRAEEAAMKTLRDAGEVSPEQLRKLHQASTSEIDYGFRDLLAERLTADKGVPLRRQKKTLSFLVNPKIRNVQYMDSKEILSGLRRSLGRGTYDQLKREVNVIHQNESAPEVQTVLGSDEFSSIETQSTH